MARAAGGSSPALLWPHVFSENDFHNFQCFVFLPFRGETQKVDRKRRPRCSGGGGNARALPSAPLFNVICVRCVLRALRTSVAYILQLSFFSLRFADPIREALPARRELIMGPNEFCPGNLVSLLKPESCGAFATKITSAPLQFVSTSCLPIGCYAIRDERNAGMRRSQHHHLCNATL